MPTVDTKYFGAIQYEGQVVLEFSQGLPGFETEHEFLLLAQPASDPLIFLQSATNSELCFVAVPVPAVRQDYSLSMSAEDLAALELPADRQPAIGSEVLALTVLSVAENGPPTLNLIAPIVVNLKTRRALQAIQTEGSYTHREPLEAAQEQVCS